LALPEKTLCHPDGRKSCFACCPPIRPPRYEHIDYRGSIQRMLRENTRGFHGRPAAVTPITGFSCWALGYLDRECRLIGCLLHPAGNAGVDLRYQVDYGEKCRREHCPQAKEFERLSPGARQFWLNLTEGLDSFSYSSCRTNILFRLLDWGSEALDLVAHEAGGVFLSRSEFEERFPFFALPMAPKGYAYFLNRLLEREGVKALASRELADQFKAFAESAAASAGRAAGPADPSAPFVHRLPLDRHFLNFIRLAAAAGRMRLEAVLALKEGIDRSFDEFLGRTRPLTRFVARRII